MAGRIAMAAKAIGATLLALAVGVLIWDYIAVHPLGPSLWYRVDVPSGASKHCGEEVSLDNAFVLIERHPDLPFRFGLCSTRRRNLAEDYWGQ